MTLNLTPGVSAITMQVFDVRRSLDPRTDPHTLRVLIGSAAFLALAHEGSREPVIVGRRLLSTGLTLRADDTLEEVGFVDRYYVLGIPVHEDREGPLWQWRVVDDAGFTITWGDWPQPGTPGSTPGGSPRGA